MEPNQINPSAETSGIPQGIPTGVFVPNNQIPAQTPVQQIAAAQISPIPVVQPTPVVSLVVAKEGPLDKVLKGIIKFFAKVMGQPDPITGAPNAASQALQKSENIVGKIWNTANQAVGKVTDVAGQAVGKVSDVANQATQQIQKMVPPQTAPTVPQAPVAPPVQPVQPVPEQPK